MTIPGLALSMPLDDWFFVDAVMDNSGQNAIDVADDDVATRAHAIREAGWRATDHITRPLSAAGLWPPYGDDAPSEQVRVALTTDDRRPESFCVLDLPAETTFRVHRTDSAVELPGRWGVDGPADMATQYAGSILEIRQGPKPALFTGAQVAPATDCPMWGDLRLDATTDPASRSELRPPAGTALTGAWTGTMTFWCIDNPDTETAAVVGQLDDGRLVLTFPWPEAQVLVLGRRD